MCYTHLRVRRSVKLRTYCADTGREGGRRARAVVALARGQATDAEGEAADYLEPVGIRVRPFYYPYLGMWHKATTLSLVALMIDLILGMLGDALNVPVDNFLWLVSAVMFMQCRTQQN
jgi:hypothetical protein